MNEQQRVPWDAKPSRLAERSPQVLCKPAIWKLPVELLSCIIILLLIDVPPNGITKRNVDLMALLLTSKRLYDATLLTLYRHVTIPHSKIFKKFLFQIAQYPPLGLLVRRFDFSHFNPIISFDTASERFQARNLTPTTLLRALELTPCLHEFLAQEHIDDELDSQVLRKLFFGLDQMQALDFCGCSSSSFQQSFTSAVTTADWTKPHGLKRLSLHNCTTLPATIFETLLPGLTQLTHLDVAGTRITDAALASLANSAQITNLNLAKCNKLSAEAIISFIATHVAVKDSLVWLSLAADARTHETFNVDALARLIPRLPKTLKSLNLRGSNMDESHIALLCPLTKQLEELALGRGLNAGDMNGLFLPDEIRQTVAKNDQTRAELDDWVPQNLRSLDLSDMWRGDLVLHELYNTSGCALLTAQTAPLEVIELPEDAARQLSRGNKSLTRLGWRVSELGDRTWIVREGPKSEAGAQAGGAGWKVGPLMWGTRKVSVAKAEAGSMYGSYM
ncbi:hypothetical protein J7T55_001673 [Diaporthe amygdali]|uniref:uncharacterized protein n=1 Tax=Phomopsis amygdali TaxID=1214568 RepID=UPI0022FDB436|nr:uncharacterized protein J7T55_001673 [Diaporthe amygdali]KAJ0100730.1 hypothetical protein J7T55_001673 [Diaporthe amygdali]